MGQDQPKNQTRVYVADRDSWRASGGFVATANRDGSGSAVGSVEAGTHRMGAEQVKTLTRQRPSILVTNALSKASFVVVWDIKASEQTKWGEHENEFVVYDRAGDLVGSGGTHRLSNAAKDICKVISSALQEESANRKSSDRE